MSGSILREDDDDEKEGPGGLRSSYVEGVAPEPDDLDDFEIVEDEDQEAEAAARPAQPEPERQPEPPAAQQPSGEEHEGDRKRQRDRAAERQRRREGKARTFAENAELKARLAELEAVVRGDVVTRLSAMDRNRVQDQLSNAERQIAEEAQRAAAAQKRMADAIASGDTDQFTRALSDYEESKERGREMAQRKQTFAKALEQQPEPHQQQRQQAPQQNARQPEPVPLSPVAVEYRNDFLENHPWFGQDKEDTQVLVGIDNIISNEGYRPDTAEYWDELERRAARYMPHRFGSDAAPAPARQAPARQAAAPVPEPTRKGPAVAGSSDAPRGPNKNPNQVRLTAGRKQALIDKGILDSAGKKILDKDSYVRHLKAYQEYDRDNGSVN